jgi:5,10-methylenetetrahydromethanopterin reductase
MKVKFHLGVMFGIPYAPELLPDYARRVEAAGFDELWLAEDCFLNGGISAAATALAHTRDLSVGLGIMPAVVRNPAFAAMEIATLARIFPGRFLPGFGHGIASWMRQIGAFPKSQLRALEEVTIVVRDLLRGDKVTFHGQHISLADAQLVFPPEHVPPVSLGVVGPKSLALSGRVADGTVIPEFSSPAFIRQVRSQIAAGQAEADRKDRHRLTVYAWCAVDSNGSIVRERARHILAPHMDNERVKKQLTPLGIVPEIEKLLADGGSDHLAKAMPDEWLDHIGAFGTTDQGLAAVERMAEAGADSVILFPLPGQDPSFLDSLEAHLSPTRR